MANTNNPHGLRPLGTSVTGAPTSIAQYQKSAANATPIYRQDVVARQSGGMIGADSITPGTTLLSGVSLDYGAASTLTTHLVVTSPDALFEVQADASSGNVGIVAANCGLNANLVYAAGTTLPPRLSGTMLAVSSLATTSTLDVHVLGLYADVNNAFGPQARIEIVINKHRLAPGVAGV